MAIDISSPHSRRSPITAALKRGRLWFCKGGTSWKQLA